jgi:RHS repeat-associated protein
VWKARIDPYGTAHVDIGADFHQPLRWPGHYYDAETGLHDNRFRTYSPELGRYLQSDPAGLDASPNLYAYTDNPLRAVDLRGLEQKCPEGTKNCPFVKEGGPDAERPPVVEGLSPRELRAAASDRKDRRAQRARKKLVRKFLEQHGQEWDDKQKTYVRSTRSKIESHMNGHDYKKPIVVGPPPSLPDGLAQYQHPKGNHGSYYTDPNSTPGEVGIGSMANTKAGEAPVPKIQKTYNSQGDPPYVKSTAAEIDDTWSVTGGPPQHAEGGAVQYTVPDRSAMQNTPSSAGSPADP